MRRALYLAAFVASRYNLELKAFRQRLRENGKPTKTALTATARKRLTHLNAIIRDGRTYELRNARKTVATGHARDAARRDRPRP